MHGDLRHLRVVLREVRVLQVRELLAHTRLLRSLPVRRVYFQVLSLEERAVEFRHHAVVGDLVRQLDEPVALALLIRLVRDHLRGDDVRGVALQEVVEQLLVVYRLVEVADVDLQVGEIKRLVVGGTYHAGQGKNSMRYQIL